MLSHSWLKCIIIFVIDFMLFSECFDTLVLACDNPFDLRDCKVIKRINSSRNILAFSPVTIAADPFLVVKDDTLYLFYEEYRYRDKGIIKMISTCDLVTWSKPKVVLDEDFHLSYPWVFEHDGQWYMMPETSAVHEVRLYRAVNNQLDRFEFAKAILTHDAEDEFPVMDFCDSSIVNKDGEFFLFTTLNHGKGNELHLYYSDSLDGGYKRHPQSPLIVSDKYGRNGGSLLEHDGVLYRFAQDCDGEYGKNVHLFKVNTISNNQYKETAFQENVLTSHGLSAGHQYNFVNFKGKYIVTIDQKRWVPFLTCKAKRLFQLLKKLESPAFSLRFIIWN